MVDRMYLVQRVKLMPEWITKKVKDKEKILEPSVDDLYRMDYMGSAEFEWGALPKSLKRICLNFENFLTYETEIKDHKGNPLFLFIEQHKVNDYINEINEYLKGNRNLKEYIELEQFVSGKGFGGKPIEQNEFACQIWWDINNDVWFTFLPGEIQKIKDSILATREKKRVEKEEGWYK